MIFKNKIYFCFLLLLITGYSGAQSLRGLSENQNIKYYLSSTFINYEKSTTLNTLPFFDDFSYTGIFPDPDKWADNYVYINNSFPVDPISSGVATFDAIDDKGDLYATGDMPVSSDKLTSNAFNLEPFFSGTSTLTLSFYYQAAGKGESPEYGDSLLLEFYMPDQDKWIRAWYTDKNEYSPFEQVIIQIPRQYYQNGFRFRFRNYTSLPASSSSGGRGALSNVDFWNLDYIMINTDPPSSHSSVKDITLTEPPRYLMDFYESVPWDHLNQAQGITRNMMHYAIRNLENEGDSVNIGRSYYVKNNQTGSTEFAEVLYSKFGPGSITRRSDPFFAPFTATGTNNEGSFRTVAYLVTPAGDYKANDSSVTVINFRDYYAYDDGIPEYGFGIPGESTYGALFAYRFRIYRADTLKSIDIFFNKTRDGFTENEKFRLCVWDDNNGKPGKVLFLSDEEYNPVYRDFPQFSRYPLNTPGDLVINDSVVYVGFVQLTEEFLNIGYDVNRDNVSRMFVSLEGEWFNPAGLIPGSLMIRPVFSTESGTVSETPEINENKDLISLYPNPARNIINISSGSLETELLEIFDVTGKPLFQIMYPGTEADISAMAPGIYYFKVTTTGGITEIRKIIIVR